MINTYLLVWDDLEFDEGRIRINPNRIAQILPSIPYKGSISELNAVKHNYFQKKYPKVLRLSFTREKFIPDHSPSWAGIKDLVDTYLLNERIKVPTKIKVKPKHKEDRSSSPSVVRQKKYNKDDYLKVLSELQCDEYKLITIKEKYGTGLEKSIIYRCKTSTGKVLIIWENTCDSRATYIFKSEVQDMDNKLSKIEAFINTGNLYFKRSRFKKLNDNKEIRKELGYIETVKNTTPESFRTDIQVIRNRY